MRKTSPIPRVLEIGEGQDSQSDSKDPQQSTVAGMQRLSDLVLELPRHFGLAASMEDQQIMTLTLDTLLRWSALLDWICSFNSYIGGHMSHIGVFGVSKVFSFGI